LQAKRLSARPKRGKTPASWWSFYEAMARALLTPLEADAIAW
jgi:hypothetical protein